MPKRLFDNIKALMLYEQGMKDAEMAAELGVTRRQIEHWRWARRLTANDPKGKTPDQARKIDEMLETTTATDKEIAAVVGLSSDAVRRHRVQRGIPVASVRAGKAPPNRTEHGVRRGPQRRIPVTARKEPEGPWTAAGMSRLAYETVLAREAGLSYGMFKAAQISGGIALC